MAAFGKDVGVDGGNVEGGDYDYGAAWGTFAGQAAEVVGEGGGEVRALFEAALHCIKRCILPRFMWTADSELRTALFTEQFICMFIVKRAYILLGYSGRHLRLFDTASLWRAIKVSMLP